MSSDKSGDLSDEPGFWNDRAGEWYFRARPCRQQGLSGQFVAWCAKTPRLGRGPLDAPPGLDWYFDFAATPEAAIAKLKAKVLS